MPSLPGRSATRLLVLSDLHLGGQPPHMMSQPKRLAAFLETLPEYPEDNEVLEVVLAGDVIDFLAIPEFSAWTDDPEAARRKLEVTAEGEFELVFKALAGIIAAGGRLTVMLGNHDLELTLPRVWSAFLELIGTGPHGVHLIDDGRAYRVGGALIEHGNRYDGANVNDWDGLRTICSARSRGEAPPLDLRVSAGSVIVEKVVSPLKRFYPFIDLLQPQGELVALLLAALEPKLLLDWKRIVHVRQGHRRQGENPQGRQPGHTWQVGAERAGAEEEPELGELFGEHYRELNRPPPDEVGVQEWLQIFNQARQGSLAQLIADGKPIPEDRLRQIGAVMRRLVSEELFRADGPTGPYGHAAERLRQGDVEVVVMGHTHLARHLGPPEKATYINTGTWADTVRVPAEIVEDSAAGRAALDEFLRCLLRDEGVRRFEPTYGDLQVRADGRVARARLCHAKI